ncbi:MAG: leucine-rich repeat domain-containing protein, partial [Promethearchaeota archaeon]
MNDTENPEKLTAFKGAQIPQFEAEIFQEIEKLTKIKFTKVNKVDWDTKMGFSAENLQVIAIGLYDCGLSTLPESISKLKSLQTLSLQHNKLSTLPESIGDLKSLTRLILEHNQLSTL